ncbi:MAG: ABC transporter substrate-binding protein [Deltaproteobacteria bacterium]|nr:MAG: ABC transporter substrate-binding protein [Deltaproteobacteria bacterium]
MRYLFSLLLSLLLSATPSLAEGPAEARELIETKIDAVMLLLQDESLEKTRRDVQILALVAPIFDYPTMAKLSLGKKHWPQLNFGEKATFSDLFIDRLQRSFLEKLDIYTDEKVLYGEPLKKGKKVHVPTTLVSKDSRIEMLYKMYRTAEGWKVYDVEISGVSVIQTYRSQFDGVLSEGSIDDLLEKLKIDGAFTIAESDETGS